MQESFSMLRTEIPYLLILSKLRWVTCCDKTLRSKGIFVF